jgi:hypothetical protein
MFGISTGGLIVIVGIILMIFWSFWIGLIIALVGLLAFRDFARQGSGRVQKTGRPLGGHARGTNARGSAHARSACVSHAHGSGRHPR